LNGSKGSIREINGEGCEALPLVFGHMFDVDDERRAKSHLNRKRVSAVSGLEI